MTIRLLVGDCRETLKTLPAQSVQCVITSPPYYGLRDYGTEPLIWGGDPEHEHLWTNHRWYAAQGNGTSSAAAFSEAGPDNAARLKAARWHDNNVCSCGAWRGSLGLEPTPELFLQHLVECFREVWRVLRDDGVMWINMGDSYAGSGKGPTGHNGIGDQVRRQGFDKSDTNRGSLKYNPNGGVVPTGLKPKDLMMMPTRVALALQADGWYLRSMIPWLKRNSMPESVTDRPATAVEYIFLLSKSARYYWDADAVRQKAEYGRRDWTDTSAVLQAQPGRSRGLEPVHGSSTVSGKNPESGRSFRNSDLFFQSWQGLMLDEHDEPLALVVNPQPFSEAHFATFPPKLVEPMIKAGTSEKGQCPECGAPWARVVERKFYGNLRTAENVDGHLDDVIGLARNNFGGQTRWSEYQPPKTTGWQPTCTHDGQPVPQTILDPFGGSGTVGLVADRLNRNAILCELKDEYADIGQARLWDDAPLFMELDRG